MGEQKAIVAREAGTRPAVPSLRQRVNEILEPANEGDRSSRAFDLFIVLLIAVNTLAIVLESVAETYAAAPFIFDWLERVSVIVFTVEYALRVWSCVSSPRFASPVRGRLRFILTPMATIDLLAIIPFYLPMIGIDLRFIRAVRLLRVFRTLKFGRYSRALQSFGRVFQAKREQLLMSALVMSLLLLLSSALMYYAERDAQPDVFGSIPSAMWWAVMTLTTVGYGDVYPVTQIGRLLGSVIAILGVGAFALPAGILGAGFVEEMQMNRRKTKVCPHCGRAIDDDGQQ